MSRRQPGKTAVELFDAMHDGRVKAVWIACTNPGAVDARAGTRPRGARALRVRRAAGSLRRHRDGAFADLLLPATTWGEKEGTVTNSERRITHVRRAVPPARRGAPDWRSRATSRCASVHAARSMTARRATVRLRIHPEQIFREHAATTRGRDLDIGGLDYAVLDARVRSSGRSRSGAAGGVRGSTRPPLRHAGRNARASSSSVARVTGRAHRCALPAEPQHRPPARPVARHEPHGPRRACSTTSTNLRCRTRMPTDLDARGLADGDLVRVRSRRGEIVLRAAGLARSASRSGVRARCTSAGAILSNCRRRECTHALRRSIPIRDSRN
jgi:assimilatory nitrate reductase catalytic subunit